MIHNKKAQGLSTNTVILLILGIFVLVFLIIGFTVGWGKIAPFLSNNNVDSIVSSCEISCSTASDFGFCSQARDLKAEDVELKGITCNYLAEKQDIYGVELCPAVSCGQILSDVASEEEAKADCGAVGSMVQWLEEDSLKSYTCLEEDL